MDNPNNQYHPNQMPAQQAPQSMSARKLHPAILAAIIFSCVIILWAVCYFGIHIYASATCTAPERCSICGKTRGDALEHRWIGATCEQPAVCSLCGISSGAAIGHSWAPATCTSAKRCTVCGATEGAPAEHSWSAATCTAPAQCLVCGSQSGSPMGHSWSAATYTAPQTCTLCGETCGSPLSKPDVDVEDQVVRIRNTVNPIAEDAGAGYYRKVTLREGVVAYYDGSELVKAVVYRHTDGIGQYSDTYSRTYYFSDNTLIFAFFEGKDSHRLYFYQGALMRWRYTPQGTSKATNHDYDFSDEYFLWEQLALDEVATFF